MKLDSLTETLNLISNNLEIDLNFVSINPFTFFEKEMINYAETYWCDSPQITLHMKMSELVTGLPKTYGSPTMAPHCADEIKYGIVDKVVAHFEAAHRNGEKVCGQPIRDLVTVNGVRVTVEDGTWGLVRASSNKPELVVVEVEREVRRRVRIRQVVVASAAFAPIVVVARGAGLGQLVFYPPV